MNLEKIVGIIKARIREEIEAEGAEFNNITRGEVMWGLVRALTNKESSPYLRIIDFGEMLSPFSEEFDKTIPPEIMENIRDLASLIVKEAKEKDVTITPMVRRHLDKITAGWVPYGYTIYSECEEDDADL
jgi:hypothetical protein